MDLREVSIGKAWSTFRVEMFQGSEKIAASADVLLVAPIQIKADMPDGKINHSRISNLSFPGQTLETGWRLSPQLCRVDLKALAVDSDPSWTSYHTAFSPSSYRRAVSYVKNYIPTQWPAEFKYIEQWVTPGWDCTPSGSRDTHKEEAQWTTDMLPFIADMNLPVQENFVIPVAGRKLPLGSIAATLRFASAQKKARLEGILNWRDLPDDGQDVTMYANSFANATLSLSIEIKKKLPTEGVRWLCLRSEIIRVQQGRMDLEVLVFDESMELVAISHQVGQIIPPVDKNQRKANL